MSSHAAPATTVLLIRHGTTATTGSLLPGRAPGLHLAPSGQEQARDLVERLEGTRIDALHASPLERTRETAAPLAAARGLEVVPEEGLLECEVGEWTGRSLAELARLPGWRTVQEDPGAFTFPGGESFTAMQARMITTIDALRERHRGGTVACFSHADPLRAYLAHALGSPLAALQRISVSPASVSAPSFPAAAGAAPVVLTVNSTRGALGDLRAS